MTREEIQNLNGKELDIAIAVEIFGHKRDEHRDGWIRLGNSSIYPKRYSQDISAAWEVEEKMNTDELFWRYTNHVKKLLLCKMSEGVNEYNMMHATPEIRCKAALLAVLGGGEA